MIAYTVQLTGSFHAQLCGLHRTIGPKSSLLPPLMPGDPGNQLQHIVLQQNCIGTPSHNKCMMHSLTLIMITLCTLFGRKRRKTQHNKPAKRVRPEVDNDQTRKLRSALPSEDASLPGGQDTNGFATSNVPGSESAAAAATLDESEEEEESDSQSRRKLKPSRLVLIQVSIEVAMRVLHALLTPLHVAPSTIFDGDS